MSRLRLGVASLGLIALVAFALGTTGTASAPGAPAGPRLAAHVPGELLIGFVPSARALERAGARAELGASHVRTFRTGAEHWRLGAGVTVEQAISRMRRNPHVAYAEPNYIVEAEVVPDDPRFGELYGMLNTGQSGGTADADIDADMAWNVSRGSRDVLVGIIDTGIDYNHPDLAANAWSNPGEIPGNSVDDDHNGFVDDVHGYDFVNNDGDPFDDNGHGTHCAGTIGAVGNNGVGVAGVNWEVSLMGLKFLSAGGSGSTANAVRAVEYATMMGASLTSNSWGGGGFSQTLYDAIEDAGVAEIPFIAAAGNNGTNNDVTPHFPSNYDLTNVISVAATDRNDAIASFSNWGLVSVDIGAPGVAILSTQPGGGYQLLSGTSMATPHVAGVAALIRSVSPGIPVAQLKAQIMSFGDPSNALRTNGPKPVASGRRLNAFFPIADPDNTPPGGTADLATTGPTSNTMGLTWSAPGDDGQTGTASYYEVRYSTSPIDDQNFGAAARAGNEPVPVAAGGPQSMEVSGLAADTFYHFAVKAFDEWGNAGALSNIATGTTLPPPTAGYAPASFSDALFTGQQSDHTLTLRNDGVGTLDFTVPNPLLSAPLALPADPVLLGKGVEPAPGDPVITASGGPDGFGYRWTDSNETGGPAFSWIDISATGTLISDVTTDDDTSAAINLGFSFPFYGSSFDQIRVCSNGWLSFTSGSTAYENTPLPSSGAPDNMVAPFWDDLNPNGTALVRYQLFGNRAIVQWTGMPRFQDGAPGSQEPGSAMTFQAILDASGTITFQYLTLNGTTNSATAGIQKSGASGLGLATAVNQAYLANGLAVRYEVLPQWLSVSPTSGRIAAGGSTNLNVHMDASGLDGGTYPGTIRIDTNDPNQPLLAIPATLVVTGAPDASVAPTLLAYGDSFLGLPKELSLTVSNVGTDVLHVSSITSGDPSVTVDPSSFDVDPDQTRTVTVTWTPPALGPFATTLTVNSDDSGQPAIDVDVTGNSIPAPIVAVDPTSLSDTLFSGSTSTHALNVSNAGGSNLIVSAAADLGTGGTGIVSSVPGALGNGGPDAFGYRWRDSDAAGGPAFNFVDISSTGTLISFATQDDSLSATIPMGMSFPLYGTSFSSMKVSTNGWLTFDTTQTASVAGNGTLPSTSLARSAIAIYWDDLHLRTGNVRYLNDGTRFIVQYTNVGRFTPSTGHSFTFQVQLYPSGRILMMYQTMSGTVLNSATIGVQNQARNIALQVVSQTGTGTAYVHNNLALLISRTPDWLTVTPAGPITIPPGGSQVFNVGFDATDRPGGTLNGGVILSTNIPSQPTVTVPATLNIIGAPVVGVIPASIGYGTVFTGFPQLASFQVANNGTDTLNVSDITTTDPSLTVEDLPGPTAAFSLAPGEARPMNLRWSATPTGPLSAQVQVHSDDPVTPTAVIAVTGNAIVAPVAGVSPSSFTESLNAGEVANRTVTLTNTGGSDLTFGAAFRSLSGGPVTVHPELDLKKEEPDPRPGILGSGGPDLFGYRWADSDQPGGPAFAWTDISAIGTPIPSLDLDDENAGPIPIGFSFPFYGGSYSTVRVTTNGWLSFTSTSTDLSNSPLPNSGEPTSLLAVFWDDLHFRGVQRARYHNDGSRFIVQWTDVDRFNTTTEQPSPAHLTFQAILYPNGRIVFQYLTMTGFLTSSTIGLQNEARNDGLTVVHNAAYMHDGLAIEFRPPLDFLSIAPSSGTVPAGGSVDLDLRIDASSLIGGDYAASLDLTTNDPAAGLISIPVNLHVTGIPEIDVQPAALIFPNTFLGFGSTLGIQVRNVGTDVLTVTGGGISGDFSAAAPGAYPMTLAVGQTASYAVTFTPTAAGLLTGSFTVTSDDADEGTVVVPLQGEGLVPPEIGVAPASISTALPPGGVRTKTLTVSNAGGSDLVWTTGTNIISVVTPAPWVELAKDEIDTRAGILGSGGPDLFGYSWKDSDEPGGPTFDWVDISSVGTPITALTADDQNAGPIAIGFPFPFYGNSFSTVRVTTNGWLSFTNTTTDFTNDPLPGTSAPENLLAVFWDDLDFRGAARARYHNDGSRFIVQWTDVDRHSTTDQPSPAHLTFQAILYPSGKIVFQYLAMHGYLVSATIGMQNAAENDGLTVVFNMPYVHDNLAIELKPIPTWATVSPSGGTIPPGGTQEVTVTLNAAGLDDGLHEASIEVSSNDPYTPLVSVPVSLNVGVMPTAWLNFDPDVLNLSAPGSMVKLVIELPAGYDPHLIDIGSIRLNGTVPALASPVSYSDENNNGIEELVARFDRAAVQATLPVGTIADVTVLLEVADVQWFQGTTTARTFNPRVTSPLGGEFYAEGTVVPIAWTPVGSGNVTYHVHLSRDGGATWEELAAGLTATSFDWTAGGTATASARVRVVATDAQGVLGYGTSDGDFVIAGAGGGAPNGVGRTLWAEVNGSDLVLKWTRPEFDATHGPAQFYRVLRSDSAQGPFTEVGTVTVEEYREPLAATGAVVYYQIIAANAAGDAID